jgi:hypothetical protein
MAQRNATTPNFKTMSAGMPSPSDPINAVNSDYIDREPNQYSQFSVMVGRVVDSWPESNTALVSVGFNAYIRCVYNVQSFGLVSAVTEVASPQIGDHVIVAKGQDTTYGIIVASVLIPGQAVKGSQITPNIYNDYRQTFFQVGRSSTFDCEELKLNGEQTSIPADLVPGEISSISETHVGRLQGKYYYRTQAGNLVAITLNSIDDVLDIIGHNLHMFNSAFRIRAFCDYGRSNLDMLFSPVLESWVKDQRKNHTNRLTSGWLSSGLAAQTNKKIIDGGTVHSDIWLDELGTTSICTTSSSWMQKLNGLYFPMQERQDDDIQGKGDKEIFDIAQRKGFKISPPDQHAAAFGCMARDYAAWQMSGDYRFKRYEKYSKDWKDPKPEEGETPKMDSGQYCKFGEIKNIKQGIKEIKNDYQQAREGEAFCGVLPDGSVLLRDAWGSSIELRGGKLVLTSVKDLEIISGKNVIALAGHDLILKSQKSAELHTTENNIRIKSGKHCLIDSSAGSVQITALNSAGPDVIEKKGDEYVPAGIVLKTNTNVLSRAPIINSVADVAVAIMGPEDDTGPFVLVRSSAALHWADTVHFMYTEAGTPPKRKGMVMIGSGSVQCGQFGVFEDTAYTKGYCMSERSLIAIEHVLTNGVHASKYYYPYVSTLKDPIKIPPEEYERYAKFGEISEEVPRVELIEDCRSPWEKEDYPEISWRYRTVNEYNTKEHQWFESFWQRQYKSELKTWDHSKDLDKYDEMAWPGKEYLDGSKDCWTTYEEENVYEDGTPKMYKEQNQEGGKFDKSGYPDIKWHP